MAGGVTIPFHVPPFLPASLSFSPSFFTSIYIHPPSTRLPSMPAGCPLSTAAIPLKTLLIAA